MQNWRVGTVGPVNSGNFSGPGFVLYDEDGQPCVMFGYSSERDAKAGREYIETALANVASVTSLR